MEKLSLAYGARELLPEDVSAAWGARLIVGQDGYVDLVPDRQDAAGDADAKSALLRKLNAVKPLKNLEAMLRDGTVSTREGGEVTVYEDADIVVRGDSHGSHGYFYIVAYPRPEAPGIPLPRKATGAIGTAAGGPIWLKLIRKVLDGDDAGVFKLLDVGPGEDGHYREAYEGADIVFPSYDESIVRVVPKSDHAAAVIDAALVSLK